MKLYLMQHGDAVSKELDAERPLSEKGSRDVQAMSSFLQRAGVRVDKIFHSGKLRAQQTADILSQQLSDNLPGVMEGISPNDDVTAFMDEIDNLELDTCIVGHLPFMARLVSCLLDTEIENSLLNFMPGSMVCLERDVDESWRINWSLRPELLL